MCKSWCELIIGAIILVFSLWATAISKWVVVIAAIVLIVHSFTCKVCFHNHENMPSTPKKRK